MILSLPPSERYKHPYPTPSIDLQLSPTSSFPEASQQHLSRDQASYPRYHTRTPRVKVVHCHVPWEQSPGGSPLVLELELEAEPEPELEPEALPRQLRTRHRF